ncbi:MAG TPA: 4,5-DOPA dioxygenase extradiol [Roseiarcus sp.]|nr:4,5-DOPA dioxygenase extradiol [Roseiarcus sp.]
MPESAFSRLAPTPRLPALFVGHGNPMNAIDDNAYSRAWAEIGARLPKPQAILCVSAHWTTSGGGLAHVGRRPKTIHDFGGFPRALYQQQYPAPGAPEVAEAAIELVRSTHLQPDAEWGLDHGAWSVLMHMFPDADVPVFQLSLDLGRQPAAHLDIARDLKPLRERGVLIIGSGNLVHNLGALNPGGAPYDWAQVFDEAMKARIAAGDGAGVAEALDGSRLARLAHPTPEHFLPALYPLGVADAKDELSFFSESFDLGSISMRSFLLS